MEKQDFDYFGKLRNQIFGIIISFGVLAVGINFMFISNIKEVINRFEKKIDTHEEKIQYLLISDAKKTKYE